MYISPEFTEKSSSDGVDETEKKHQKIDCDIGSKKKNANKKNKKNAIENNVSTVDIDVVIERNQSNEYCSPFLELLSF
ncbi:hypothetical protein RFI_31712 [Reticulomyxa filosa]|uniref:Uncharacterized protein n=1 Tax=Reticulomyxa filosa TaxID=46433 RepID=X6LVM4_RETFI|nr:hypothetical protein RFI_31712 [Reticulomyxa filosa]|eukprot:ETO05684.1 hypothetical protein RFI_31712 [Reticulomyxa filosa]